MKYFSCKADAALYLLIKPHWLAYLLLLSYLLHSKMWIIKLLLWTFLLFTTSSAYPRLLYTAEEILRYRSHYELPAALHFHRETLRRRSRYIHRGSRRNFCVDHNGSIPSLWSVGPRKSIRAERPVDRSLLAAVPWTSEIIHDCLKLSVFNVRSFTNKAVFLSEYCADQNLDIVCLTETWQQPNDFLHLNQALPRGFVYIAKPRASGKGGGLALMYRETLKVIPVTVRETTSCENTGGPAEWTHTYPHCDCLSPSHALSCFYN